ncbi:hypothetical protein L9F63_016909, partial [Diploptera punctata]
MLKVQLCCPKIESYFPFAVPGEIMQTEADVPPITELQPIEETSSVTGVTLVQEEMTVKEEDGEDSPVLPPGEASTGTEPETSIKQDAAEQIPDEFSPATQPSPTSVMSPPAVCSPQGQEELEKQHQKSDRGRGSRVT